MPTEQLELPRDFATGSAPYTEESGGLPPRIYVSVRGQSGPRRLLAVDTGADRSLLQRETAEAWGVYDVEGFDAARDRRYLVRGMLLRCDEGTVALTLEADRGIEVEFQVLVRFPTVDEDEAPVEVLGYRGGLDRIRFAVDPPPASRWFFGLAPG